MKLDWLLVEDARRGVLRCWNPLAAAVLMLGLLQVLLGRWAETEGLALLWLGIQVLPATLLLYISVWLHRHPEKLVPPGAYRSLSALVILFLIVAFLTLLLVGPVIQSRAEWGHRTYLLLSFKWMIPLNISVLLGIVLVFYRKESIWQPNASIIMDAAKVQMETARNATFTIQEQCLELILGNQIDQVFERLKNIFPLMHHNSDFIIILQSRYNTWKEHVKYQTLSPDKAQIELNQIIVALLNATKEVKQ